MDRKQSHVIVDEIKRSSDDIKKSIKELKQQNDAHWMECPVCRRITMTVKPMVYCKCNTLFRKRELWFEGKYSFRKEEEKGAMLALSTQQNIRFIASFVGDQVMKSGYGALDENKLGTEVYLGLKRIQRGHHHNLNIANAPDVFPTKDTIEKHKSFIKDKDFFTIIVTKDTIEYRGNMFKYRYLNTLTGNALKTFVPGTQTLKDIERELNDVH